LVTFMSTVYGPVPSWRFGRSLGVDIITPPKKCTFDCVYCQLGRTKNHVSTPEDFQDSLPCPAMVISDLDNVLGRIDLRTVDVVTFSGNGEPTLNLSLGEIAQQVKTRIGGLPMVVLTNSSLLHRQDVRRSLSMFDFVVAKLDAADNEVFKQVNRPAAKELNSETIIESIKQLKKEIRGTLALEIMLLQSADGRVTNVKSSHLENLVNAITSIQPDIVQLEVPYRPPSERYILSPDKEKLEMASQRISEVLSEERVWTYGIHDRRGKKVRWLEHKSLEEDVLELLKRRPCRTIDVSTSLGINETNAQKILEALEKKGKIKVAKAKEQKFYVKR
jgi:wyosine [tRNA(Phe)-imidazoG37] synthetase (radical SAM superfamily)